MRRNLDLLCAPFTMTHQNVARESEVGKHGDLFFRWSEGSWIRVVIDAIYSTLLCNLRSKSYLVFKISSDVMTKHCCQVCVLSMMFCRSDPRLCWPCWHGKWWRNRKKTWVPRGSTLRQANAENDMKNILYIWFSHFTLTGTHRWYNYSLSYFTKNKNSHLRYWQHRNRLSKLLDCAGIAVE